MNKKEFMNQLKSLIPPSESQEILVDFEEHFATGLADGKSEEEIVRSLGSPVDIASEYGYDVQNTPWASTVSPGTRTMAAIGLILFDLLIGIAIISSLIGVWVSLWAVVVSLLAAAVASMFSGIFVNMHWLLGLVTGISLLGLTTLVGIGMLYVTKYFWKLLVWYGKLHANVFTGK